MCDDLITHSSNKNDNHNRGAVSKLGVPCTNPCNNILSYYKNSVMYVLRKKDNKCMFSTRLNFRLVLSQVNE